jgi:hypothetical protein
MARQENVVRIRQVEPVAFLLICSNWPRLVKAIQISPSKNIGRNHQLIASHFRFAPDFVWIDVDQFDDEITIRSGHRGDQIHDRRSADFQWLSQDFRGEGEYVGATGGLALVADQLNLPIMLPLIALDMDWSPQERDWLRRIGHVLFEIGLGGTRRGEPEFSGRLKIKPDRIYMAFAARGPSRHPLPPVSSRLKGGYWC